MTELTVHIIVAVIIIVFAAANVAYFLWQKPKAYKEIAESVSQLADTYGPEILRSVKRKPRAAQEKGSGDVK